MKAFLKLFLVICSLTLSYCLAFGIGYPPVLQEARVLPVGETVFSFSGLGSEVGSEFDGEGRRTAERSLLLRELTWKQVIGQASGGEKADLRKLQLSQGKEEGDVALRERVVSRGERFQYRPLWAFGLSERWTVGAMINLVYERRRVEQSLEWVHGSRLKEKKPLRIHSPPTLALNENGDGFSLENQSVEGLDSGFRYHIGDVEILGLYLLKQESGWAWALRHKLVLPTSPPPDPYSIDPVSAGEGQFDVGIDSLWQWWWTSGWSLSASLGYLVQLPDHVAMRIPHLNQSFASGHIDVNVKRDPGDEFLMNFTLIKKMASAWKLRLGCAFAQKGPDLFSGQSFQKSQYSMLGFGSATKSVLGQMGLSYSPELLNRWFNRGFHLLGVNLDLHAPLWGMNISANPIFELGLSFAY